MRILETTYPIFLLVAALLACKGGSRSDRTDDSPAGASNPAPVTTPLKVALTTLLSEYHDNEVRADSSYKGRWIETSGVVGDVKKDIMDDIYVIVGTGNRFEIPTIQCFMGKAGASSVAALSKGDKITVRGRVEGLMMNVLVKECQVTK
jgi:hypothetical protein